MMHDLPWYVQHKNILRQVIVVLFITSMLGPWMFDVIHVPAEYSCSAPNVRLHGDFCGMPLSGVRFFEWFVGGFFYMIPELIKGTFAGRYRELLIGLLILPLIPFLTTLTLIWKKEAPRLHTFNLVAWILALLLTLTLFFLQMKTSPVIRLWGLWFYIILAISVLILELVLMKRKNNITQPT